MILYLTYNDAPSGIYSSQVIDVVKFISGKLNLSVKLVAFISLRNFGNNKKRIKNELPSAIVLPMFPGVHRWRYNLALLKLICVRLKPVTIIGRSVLATNLAFGTKVSRIVYDGRGAISAEWKEYNVVNNKSLLNEIQSLERKAIQLADYRLAVSNQLVNHWKDVFDYKSDRHIIIPCTLNKTFETIELTEITINKARQELQIDKDDLVFAYSGSTAGWQSFELIYQFLNVILLANQNAKILFLSDENENIERLQREFGTKIICKKVQPAEVPQYLISADFGLLIREQSITNKVASPVKFAEYLACGLKVIISEDLGDYSEYVCENNCGYISSERMDPVRVSFSEKQKLRSQALNSFCKKNYLSEYQKLIGAI